MELTDSIHEYVIKRVTNLGKLLMKYEAKGEEVIIDFDVAKTTNHHKSGDFFKASCNIAISGKNYNASSEEEDMYAAIDGVKEKLFREIRQEKEKNRDLFKRGASKVKSMMKGIKWFKK